MSLTTNVRAKLSNILALTQLSYYCFVKVLFLPKNADKSKIKDCWYQKVYFLKLHMYMYLGTTFQVFSIILIICKQRWVVILHPPFPPRNEFLRSPPRLRLKKYSKLSCISLWLNVVRRQYLLGSCKGGLIL